MRRVTPVIAAFLATRLFAQQPVFERSGVLNAASLLRSDQPMITPGMILAIKGQNLAITATVADPQKFPQSLGGTSVTFNGLAAPILFASPDQVNVQVPGAVRGKATADIVII